MKRTVLLLVAAAAAGAAVRAQGPSAAPAAQDNKRIIRVEAPAGWGVAPGEDPKTHIVYKGRHVKGVSVGFWDANGPRKRDNQYPEHSEFMHILQGSVTITDRRDGRKETFKAGDSLLMQRGAEFTWDQPEKFRKVFVAFERDAAPPATTASLEAKHPTFLRIEMDGPAGVGLKENQDGSKSYVYHAGRDGSAVGIWETPGLGPKTNPDLPKAELMLILKGEVTASTPDGQVETLKAGQIGLVPNGITYTWKSGLVRKIFVVFDTNPKPKTSTTAN